MVNIVQIRIIGILSLALGLLLFIAGIFMWDKRVFATSFMLLIVACIIIYYTGHMDEKRQ